MKKIALLALSTIMALTIFGCSSDDNQNQLSDDLNSDELTESVIVNEANYKEINLSGFTFEILDTLEGSGMIGYFEDENYFFDIEIFEGETLENIKYVVETNFIDHQLVSYADLYSSHEYDVESETGFGELVAANGETYDYNVATVYYNDGSIYSMGYMMVDDYSIYIGAQAFDEAFFEQNIEILKHALSSVKILEEGDMTITVEDFSFEIPNFLEFLGTEGQYATENMYFSIEVVSGETVESMKNVSIPNFLLYQEQEYDEFVSYKYREKTDDLVTDITLNNGETYSYNILDIEFEDDITYSQAFISVNDNTVYIGVQSVSDEYIDLANEVLMSAIMSCEQITE